MSNRSDAFKALVVEMLVDAGVSFDPISVIALSTICFLRPVSKSRMLLTLLVSELPLRKVRLGLLMALICLLGVYLSLERRPLLI